MNQSFGHTLRRLRMALVMSQEQLANELGSTQRHISFLETGRTRPTRAMLGRIITALNLTPAQCSALFRHSGFHNPYVDHGADSAELSAALDLIETRILQTWPWPAFALDPAWNILRANRAAISLMSPFMQSDQANNLLSIFLSPAFSALVENWDEVATTFYFRVVAAAEKSPELAAALAAARKRGIFDHIPSFLTETESIPLYVPARLLFPDGRKLELTSLVAHFAASHDATMSGVEIEMMFPLDDDTADLFAKL